MRVCIVFAVDGFAQNNQVRFCVGSFVERFAQRNQVQVCVGLFRGRVFSEYSGAICVESFCGTVGSKYPGASLCSFFVEELKGQMAEVMAAPHAAIEHASLDNLHPLALEDSLAQDSVCLLYTSPSPRDGLLSRMPSSA